MDYHSIYIQTQAESVAGKVEADRESPFQTILKYVSYFLSAVFLLGGLFVIFGALVPANVPKQFRIMLGIVLILWAIYRFVVTQTKSRQREED